MSSWGKKKTDPELAPNDVAAKRQPNGSQMSDTSAASTAAIQQVDDKSSPDGSLGDEKTLQASRTAAKRQPRHRETAVSRGSDIAAPVPKLLSQKALLEFMIGLDYPLEGKDYFIAWLTRTYTRKGRSRKSTGKARTIVLDFLMEVFQKLKKEGYQ